MERFLSQIMNMVLRKFMNKGINAGIKHAASRGKSPKDMTPAEREQAKRAQDLAGKARQMAKIGRRMGR